MPAKFTLTRRTVQPAATPAVQPSAKPMVTTRPGMVKGAVKTPPVARGGPARTA